MHRWAECQFRGVRDVALTLAPATVASVVFDVGAWDRGGGCLLSHSLFTTAIYTGAGLTEERLFAEPIWERRCEAQRVQLCNSIS